MNQAGRVERPLISALLIDVSGNLHVGSDPTPGAVDALGRLLMSGFPFRLCSNTSKESTADLVERLDALGFGISEAANNIISRRHGDEISRGPRLVWTSIGAVAQTLKEIGSTTPYLLLSESARSEVMNDLYPGKKDPTKDTDYDAVVIGLAPTLLNYEHLNNAFRILKGEMTSSRSATPWLIATHRAKYIQSSSGKLSLGPGPFVTALETAAGPNVRIKVVGKPEAAFFDMVIKDFHLQDIQRFQNDSGTPSRIAVIGDDVEADLGGGAVELGLWRILVKTGKYRPGDESRPGVIPPDEVYDSFATFVDSLLENKT